MATLKDVAKRAGVGLSTASYALNNRPEIREETKNRVFKAVEELNYKPHGLARDLKRSRIQTIGLIVSDLSGPFYSELIKAIEAVVCSSGYHLVACSTYGGRNSTALRFLQEKRTDGILSLAQDIDAATIRKTAGKDFPIVLLDREIAGDYIWSVTVNNKEGAYKLVDYLARIGYREIGFIRGPDNAPDSQQRFMGYREALEKNNLNYAPGWCLPGQFTVESGFQAANILLMQKKLPQAIFAANDEMAIGAMDALGKAGIRVPEDVALVGFDDIEISSYVRPRLTTVRQPKYQLGSIAAQMIFRALNGDFSLKKVTLNTELIIRESCRSAL